MKVRSGFVSNSSSSSFIVDQAEGRTTAYIAYQMIRMLWQDRGNWGLTKKEYKEHQRSLLRAIHYLQRHFDLDVPIMFPWSCNYETFIWRNKDGAFCVDTCNNDPWDNTLKDIMWMDEEEMSLKHDRPPKFLEMKEIRVRNSDFYHQELLKYHQELLKRLEGYKQEE